MSTSTSPHYTSKPRKIASSSHQDTIHQKSTQNAPSPKSPKNASLQSNEMQSSAMPKISISGSSGKAPSVISLHCNAKYLPNLHKYKATSIDYSLTRTYILKPYLYEPLHRIIPQGMHPNLVTLSGFIFILVLVYLTIAYSDAMRSESVPSWVFYACAFCLFSYQTLDNLDGMQARRTGSSSALGELFDHGTDSIVTILAAYAWMMVCARGISVYGFLFSLCPAIPFIAATWQEYWDHSLTFGYLNGPTEGLLSVMGGIVLAGLIGHQTIHLPLWELMQYFGIPTTWLQDKLTALGISWLMQHSLIHLANCIVLLISILVVLNHFVQIFKHKPSDFPRRLLTLIPHTLELTCTYLWLASSEGQSSVDGTEGDLSGSGIPAKFPVLFWLNHAFLFAYLASQITLAFVMNAPLARFFYALVPYLIGCANAHFHFLPFSEELVFGCIFAWSVGNYFVFVLDVAWNVSSALDIGVLRLNARQMRHMRELQKEQ